MLRSFWQEIEWLFAADVVRLDVGQFDVVRGQFFFAADVVQLEVGQFYAVRGQIFFAAGVVRLEVGQFDVVRGQFERFSPGSNWLLLLTAANPDPLYFQCTAPLWFV